MLIAAPAAALFVLAVPWVALANRLTGDGGPLLYQSERVGQGGRTFLLAKFRTMRVDAVGLDITVRNDARVTRIGRVLRRTKLDELPQILNVIRGEMSIVGPRPESPRYVDWDNPLHRFVFTSMPGVTGPAQLLHRHEEDVIADEQHYLEVVLPRKLALDAAYLRNGGVRQDLRLVLRTIRAVLTR